MEPITKEKFEAIKVLTDDFEPGKVLNFLNDELYLGIRKGRNCVKVVVEIFRATPAGVSSVSIDTSSFKEMDYDKFCKLIKRTVDVIA